MQLRCDILIITVLSLNCVDALRHQKAGVASFSIVNASSAEVRSRWENTLMDAQKLFLHSTDSKNSTAGHGTMEMLPILGPSGICSSCKTEGHIFTAASPTTNTDGGVLSQVRVVDSGKDFPTTRIYSVDEYRLGNNLPNFWWASIPCTDLYSPRCMGNPSLTTPAGSTYIAGVNAPRKETWTQKALSPWSTLIEAGSNVIDIGANIGDTTIEMAVHAKNTIAIEAHPQTALMCEAQAIVNPNLNIKVHPVAAGDTDGSLQLNVDCNGCNAGPVETREWVGAVISVPKVRLDTFLLEKYGAPFFKKVSLIKIDVEGYDKTLLRVLKPLLAIHRPKFWVEWFDPWWTNGAPHAISPNSADLFAAIAEIGYKPVHPVTRLTLTPENSNGTPDLLLLPL